MLFRSSGDLALQFGLALASLWAGAVALRLEAPPGSAAPGFAALAAAPPQAARAVFEESRSRLADGVRLAGHGRRARVLRGAGLALPVVALFFALLGEADPTLGAWRAFLADSIAKLSFAGPAALFVAVGALSLGVFGSALHSARVVADAPQPSAPRGPMLCALEQRIVIGAVGALLGLFLALQASDLFGNPGARYGSGVTLAEAVHRGFTQLSLVATLSIALILALERRVAAGGGVPGRALSLVLVLECLLLLLSAHQRLAAYEAAYGYTRLRLLVGVYIGLTAAALLALARELWGRVDHARLARRVALATALAALALGYWNHSAWIVRQNVERYARSGRIDLPYLALSTGPDAVPELLHALPGFAPEARACTLRWLALRYGATLGPAAPAPAWYEWSLRHTAARAAFARVDLGAAAQAPVNADAHC